jgi:Glycosyl hydrolases family 28
MQHVYSYAPEVPKSPIALVSVNGVAVDLIATDSDPFASFPCEGPSEVVVEFAEAPETVSISPRRHGIVPLVEGRRISFTIPGPIHLAILLPGSNNLFIWADEPETVPNRSDENLLFFEAGKIHDVGEIHLTSHQKLFIQGGAVVRGIVRAANAENITIYGNGVLEGISEVLGPKRTRMIVLEGCQKSVVRDIVMIRPTVWMLVLGACQDILIKDVKQVGTIISSDGIDIVGSERVTVKHCSLRNGDDCIVIKSLDLRGDYGVTLDMVKDVRDIDVSDCMLFSYVGGNALEIGHELRCNHVTNIRMHDCDVLGVHHYGAAFSIHNADHAEVSNIVWENIRVEHHYDKLVDLSIVHSRWSHDKERGAIRNVIFRNIEVFTQPYNEGYSCSIIGGYDAEHVVEGIHFENFRFDGKPIANGDDLYLFTKQSANITFASS